jgi:hypothetical protein
MLKGFMAHSSKTISKTTPDNGTPAQASRVSQGRSASHLKDEVYREMLLLEVNRPGAEMGLALALLRAIVQSESLSEQAEFRDWLRTICPVGLRMIEIALGERCKRDQEER